MVDEGMDSVQATGASGVVTKRRVAGRLPIALGLVVALAGGALGTTWAFAGNSAGSSTPAEAVTALLGAVQNSDGIGVLDALDPGERQAIEPGLTSLVSNLKRLNVLSSGAALTRVTGISVRFENIATTTRMLNASLATVAITGGTVVSSTDAAKLPLGSFVTNLADSAIRAAKPTTTSAPASTGKSAIATVKVDGTWYVSLGYTIAVDATGGAAAAPPPAGLQATGASSPDAAVRTLLDDLSTLDLSGIVADLSPDEMSALQQYAPRFLPSGQATIDVVAKQVTITPQFALSSSSLGNDALVKVTSFAVTVTHGPATYRYANGCITITGASNVATGPICSTSAASLASLPAALRALVDRLRAAKIATGFITVEVGGRWFVSPTRTLFQELDATLAALRPQDLLDLAAYARAFEAKLGSLALPTTIARQVPLTAGSS
ncbi:MAG: hypothetical protein JWO62_1794 [Acidimicrobiaceae bacterium]|jgi:hypothetical protein|nr:hypothetical protein [Acidimicrobiaceae bacterium]